MNRKVIVFSIILLQLVFIFSVFSSNLFKNTSQKVELKEIYGASNKLSIWAESFIGKTKSQVLEELDGFEPKAQSWEFNQADELLLEFKLPDCKLSIYFHIDRVITVSVFVLT